MLFVVAVAAVAAATLSSDTDIAAAGFLLLETCLLAHLVEQPKSFCLVASCALVSLPSLPCPAVQQ